jgi:hypothetical protein
MPTKPGFRVAARFAWSTGEFELNDKQNHGGGRRDVLEKAIAKILHRHCNFGWANYYIPSEKFPGLIDELLELFSPGGEVGHEELVQFFLSTQRVASVQDRVAKLAENYSVYRRG